MAQANAALSDELQRNPAAREKYDIERVSKDQAHVVQMELHCGVASSSRSDTAVLPDIVLPGRDHPSNHDSDDDDDNDNANDPDDNADNDAVPKRPLIEELN